MDFDVYNEKIDNAIKDVLNDFLEILVDYIASGHFGLYRRIAEGTERRSPVPRAIWR